MASDRATVLIHAPAQNRPSKLTSVFFGGSSAGRAAEAQMLKHIKRVCNAKEREDECVFMIVCVKPEESQVLFKGAWYGNQAVSRIEEKESCSVWSGSPDVYDKITVPFECWASGNQYLYSVVQSK